MRHVSLQTDAKRPRPFQHSLKDSLTASFHSLALDSIPSIITSSDAPTIADVSFFPLASTTFTTSTTGNAMDSVPSAKTATSTSQSTAAHLAGSNGYVPSSRVTGSPDQEPGTTLSSEEATAHLVAQHSALAGSFNSALPASQPGPPGTTTNNGSPAPFVPKVEKLSYSNYTFWYMSLRLAAALYRCEDHIISDPPQPADPDGKDTHRRAAAQAWLLLTQSIPEEIRHQLTIDDLSSTPHAISEKLKQVVVSRPENSRVYLMSRAQNTILRQGESMTEYLAFHDDIRQRMILVDHIKEDDEATSIFILCGLRQNPDYTDVYTSLSMKSASSSLTLAALKHDLLREEQYLKTKQGQTYAPGRGPSSGGNGTAGSTGNNGGGPGNGGGVSGGDKEVSRGVSGASGGSGTSGGPNGASGMWCSYHEVSTHDTEQCQAKMRHEAMGNKWCTYHESHTHDTTECKAKARQETMGTKWCSFHESHSHNTEECEAKRRQEDYNSKWCSYHESHTHNTDECQAKARHDALYAR